MKISKIVKNLCLLLPFSLMTACNSSNSYVYKKDKVKPAIAKVIDLDEAYTNGWSLKCFERGNSDEEGSENNFKEIHFNFFDLEEVNYGYKKLIVYSDYYFALAYQEIVNETYSMFVYHVRQFYGLNYKYELVGELNKDYVPEEKDINIDNIVLYDDCVAEDWYLKISEYNEKTDNFTKYNEYIAMPTNHETNYTHFFFRRVMQDKYFAINYKDGRYDYDLYYGGSVINSSKDGNTILGFLGEDYSYNFNYSTIHEKFVL